VPQNPCGPPPSIEDPSAKLLQVDKVVVELQKSLDQLQSEVGATMATSRFSSAAGSNIITPSELGLGCEVAENSASALTSATSASEGRTDDDTAGIRTRLSTLEAICEDLRNGLGCLQERIAFPEATEFLVQKELTNRLEQFRAELEEKLKHLTPGNIVTEQKDCDEAIPLDAANQESPTAPDVNNPSDTVTSVYVILRKEVIQEVGQLRSYVESEVESLRSKLQSESAKVEQNVIIVRGFEAERSLLSKRVAEVSQGLAKLQKATVEYESEVSELRSRLEVVVRGCDEYISQEQSRLAEESAAFILATSADLKGLSDRVQSLENTCQQQATAMPSVVLEAAESRCAELRKESADLVLEATESRWAELRKEFADLTESKDQGRCCSPHNVASLDKRLGDLEAAYAAESKKLVDFENHRGSVDQGLSQEMQNTWAVVKSQIALVMQSVDFLQKQYTVVQERLNSLGDSVNNACLAREVIARGVGISNQQKQQNQQQRQECQQQQERRQPPYEERESMRGNLMSNISTPSVPVAGMSAVSLSQPCVHSSIGVASVSSSRPSMEHKVPQDTGYEKAVAKIDKIHARQAVLAEEWASATKAAFEADVDSVRDLVAGKAMPRLVALEATKTQNEGEISSTRHTSLASTSRPAIVLEERPSHHTASKRSLSASEKKSFRRSCEVKAHCGSAVICAESGQLAAPKGVIRIKSFERATDNRAHETIHGPNVPLVDNQCVASPSPTSSLRATPTLLRRPGIMSPLTTHGPTFLSSQRASIRVSPALTTRV